MRMKRHLNPPDFVDLLEGVTLDPWKTSHFERCRRCQETLAALAPCFQEVDEGTSQTDLPPAPDPDWSEFRSRVRDALLARSVRRSSWLGRWRVPVGLTPPPAAWGVAVPALIVLVTLTLGSLWLARSGRTTGPDDRSPDLATAELFQEDAAALETEALAWSEGDFFIALNELDESEADRLLELISLTLDGEGGV